MFDNSTFHGPDATYYIPADEHDDEDADVQWVEYCRIASTVDRTDILAVLLEELDTPTSPLYDLIDDALEHPYTPGERPKTNIIELVKVGQAILNLVAQSVDNAVSMHMACEEVRS
jgi:hypothetical protein